MASAESLLGQGLLYATAGFGAALWPERQPPGVFTLYGFVKLPSVEQFHHMTRVLVGCGQPF